MSNTTIKKIGMGKARDSLSALVEGLRTTPDKPVLVTLGRKKKPGAYLVSVDLFETLGRMRSALEDVRTCVDLRGFCESYCQCDTTRTMPDDHGEWWLPSSHRHTCPVYIDALIAFYLGEGEHPDAEGAGDA
jgi:hypothetical protein